MLLARAIGARKILEIGTLGGYSTIWLARALLPKGRLVTLEADPDYAKVASANIARAGLERLVEIRVGRALDTLPSLAAEAPFDFIFIDADKPSTPGYFQWAVRARAAGLAHRRGQRGARGRHPRRDKRRPKHSGEAPLLRACRG